MDRMAASSAATAMILAVAMVVAAIDAACARYWLIEVDNGVAREAMSARSLFEKIPSPWIAPAHAPPSR